MKNLFLNLYADINKISLGEAKGEIKHRVVMRMRKVFRSKGYTYQEGKEATDNILAYRIEGIFNNGDLNLSGETFDFTNLLFEPYLWRGNCPKYYLS